MATLEKKALTGLDGKLLTDLEVYIPLRLENQEACTCEWGSHINWVQPIAVGRFTYEPGKTYKVDAETAKALQAKLDLAEKAGWQYVNIPQVDLYGYKFASGKLRINKEEFSVGTAHNLPANLAPTLIGLIQGRQDHDIKLMSSDINVDVLRQLQGSDTLTKAAGGAGVRVGSPSQLGL